MDYGVFVAVMSAVSPLLVALFTWITRRGLDRRAAEAQERAAEISEHESRLKSQRDDFLALIDPLQATVTSLRGQVEALRSEVRIADRNVRRLVKELNGVLRYVQDTYGDPGPTLSPEVQDLVEAEK